MKAWWNDNLAGFEFADPWFLLLLLLIPGIAIIKGKWHGSAAIGYSSTSLLRKLGNRRGGRGGWFAHLLLYLALGSLAVAMARPRNGKSFTSVHPSGVDILLALDVSRSMLAEDFTIGGERVSRVAAVRHVTESFIANRPNDRLGLMGFAGQPYLVSPLTLDHEWLLENLERVKIGLVEDGTAIGSAIASGTRRLKDRESKSRILIVLTDGENNSGKVSPLTAAQAAAALGVKVYTIGAGTRGTAPYPFQDQFGRVHYQRIRVNIDEDTLRKIAEMTGGVYFRATGSKSLEEIYREIDKLEKTEIEVSLYREYKELFNWFLTSGFALLGLSMTLEQTLWRRLP